MLVIGLVLFASIVFARQLQVSGKVIDSEDNGPLPAVTIVEKGTTKWNGYTKDSSKVISGMYFCEMSINGSKEVIKLMEN